MATPTPAAIRPSPVTRRQILRGTSVAAVAALGVGSGLGAAHAASPPAEDHAASPRPLGSRAAPDLGAVRKVLAGLIEAEGLPGAQAVITGADGRVREVGVGAGDLASGRPYPHLSRLRVASHTKSFIATVVLQLVAEGRVRLEAPVERYLPGVVRGHGNDGRRISVHQMLQHTSGLPDFPDDLTDETPGHFTPEAVVRRLLSQPPLFPPGDRWWYCNLNYILLGMLVERVTGHGYEREVERRVIEPLGLAHTYWPRWPEQRLRGPHPKAYAPVAGGGHREITFINTSLIGSAGALVSTAQDLTTLYTAQLAGELLPPAQLALMRDTMPAADLARGAEYGLGLVSYPIDGGAGGRFWGHGGTVDGTRTRGGVTEDGRAVFVAVNEVPAREDASQAVVDAVDRIFQAVPAAE
ncbi:serine hydrolase domain-containing protein [Streptomyces sp. NPDC050610]|uniref:serine hydrolase domain-containing protein n=1 Tax=Streptomyces sp. NPDC050610 TaxID=3157097 RepID=UPI003413062F